MAKIFRRDWKLTLGTLDVSTVDIAFKVKRTKRAEPNKAEIKVWNLTEAHRTEIAKQRGSAAQANRNPLPVRLEAGYVGETFLVFQGKAALVTNRRDVADWITEVHALDGGFEWKSSRVSRSFPPGTSTETVLRACAAALGVGEGNINDLAGVASIPGVGRTFPNGTTLFGSASRELDGIVRSLDLTWSIQNGALQLQRRGKPLQKVAVRLAPETGLVNAPAASAQDNKKTRGLSTARALMIPGLDPGRKVVLDSAALKGSYEVVEANYSGETAGQDWYVDLGLRIYEAA